MMQDQQRTLFNCPESYPSSACGSVYATPYNNIDSIGSGHRQQMATYPAYYVESPSTVLDMSSISYRYDEDQRTSEPFSASLLSRSTSFLSNCTSEAVSLPDVSARLRSWSKSRPAASLVTTKWETCDEEAGLGAEEDTRSRCREILKSLALWSCMTVFLTAFLLALSTSMYWLVCHPHAPSTTFQVRTSLLSLPCIVRLRSHFLVNEPRHVAANRISQLISIKAENLPIKANLRHLVTTGI